jgi:hypothetical protein
MMTGYFKPLLILLGLLCGFNLFAGEKPDIGYLWVITDTVAPPKRPGEDYREIEVTPSVSTNVPNSQSFRNEAVSLFLRLREPTVTGASGYAFLGGKIVIQYDIRALDETNARPRMRAETKLIWGRSRPLLKLGYYRGRLNDSLANALSGEWVTILAPADRSRLLILRDSGGIDISEDSGLSWTNISRPGRHEFALTRTPKGSCFVAVISVPGNPQRLAAKATTTTKKNWYCVASTADDSRLVVAGGPSQSAPAMTITRSRTNSIIAWSALFTGYLLQRNPDLSSTNWVTLTNTVEVIDGQNQVTLPLAEGRTFFRLAGGR